MIPVYSIQMAHAATIMALEVVLIAFYEFIFVDVGVVQAFVVNTEIVHPFYDLFSNSESQWIY